MFFGINLNEIFTFPFKDAESRKYFLIGCLVSLAAFIVPILPYFVLYGYVIRIAKQIMNNESPRMVPWDDWEEMFKSGARVFGIRIIYSLPILVFAMPLFISMFAMPFVLSSANSSEVEAFIPIFMLFFFGAMCFLIPLSIPLGVIIPAAEMHVVENNEFAAGFRVREWWQIFRANTGGFLAAFGIYYIASMILVFAIQILMVTIILACLLPFVIPALTMYLTLIMYVTIAQAYRDAKMKLAQAESMPLIEKA